MKNEMQHYHDYEIIFESKDGLRERCKECGKTLVTKKGTKGRVDNSMYLKEHTRDFAQPGGATSRVFNRFYSKKK